MFGNAQVYGKAQVLSQLPFGLLTDLDRDNVTDGQLHNVKSQLPFGLLTDLDSYYSDFDRCSMTCDESQLPFGLLTDLDEIGFALASVHPGRVSIAFRLTDGFGLGFNYFGSKGPTVTSLNCISAY